MQENETKEVKKWTLMFFFASDNNLSASMLYQLKSIKSAGFQPDTNVLVHFDPHERGIPSMIFEINRTEKKGHEHSRIGDGRNPIIRNLAGDQVEPELIQAEPDSSTKPVCPVDYDEQTAEAALAHFLDFCRENYPAKQYMLFLVGHGLVVGRDAFLPDDNPNSGISLVELGTLLDTFQKGICEHGGELELLGMHSCSMSAVEVAYQLKGKAKYMLASEGLSFVGAWPYRQMLQKMFCAIDDARQTEVNVAWLAKQVHELCVHNSADFIFAGYSSDLCLCSLDPERVDALSAPIQELATTLQAGLDDRYARERILLAHWKSQSYFQDVYTDLYDFCLCLSQSCSDTNRVQRAMKRACRSVIDALTPGRNGPILETDFCGAECQYSYGLSIYFPWSRPIEDAYEHVIKNYETYAFVNDLHGASWLEFLNAYFEKTLRNVRQIEFSPNPDYDRDAALRLAKASFKALGFRTAPSESASTALTGKVNPSDAGGYWVPSTIKNYSRSFSISEGALKVFAQDRGQRRKLKSTFLNLLNAARSLIL